ncbi:bifunctional D-glycero-beta-D-manno-heptose-7-phosphate kinase/D-glycero-beta-D-manno-heptose 1-phosphate adenylyltransferase HldE [Ferrimonas sp. SCSIO 43195]|uniref:bifunctional D-glycero-beta-D-manno-heptose-7-phosphate kinase/D-glycero-beta-D-manno-heptose 1-phosphate adenylyltransferase HldE n=1 Tax=Ferrimonas sp. SCSIO 43195 TaxID=2822844 RepID=UPI002074EE15|nr:bifunctional D-glycero-beta-D-manno-heptose-7-phosphate kinase/D-glycero-beta-D-manno-heptose 1-phosphate adenylyltransferase HldE [Ferrimonas sp. SCSIO 43195]USD37017.1 bifunctional D-glycero-beta-D-manno-heptose-7-phosphate kinase/D-glycero-beta-D-manno-heptose 1-phosphate adenylyltransferase HldE [Ferrimonas sp. SCSIO 43195]
MKVSLPAFDQARVLVVGDVMLDRYWTGPTGRISPEAPVPVVKVEQIEDRPGGAANVALNIAALGGQAQLVGLVGKDEAADALRKGVEGLGVRESLVEVAQWPTITKLRVLSRNQQLIRLDFEESFAPINPALIAERTESLLPGVGALVLSDYAKGALTDVGELVRLGRQAGVPVLVDPKGSDFEKYRGATLLTPNMSEFEQVVGPVADEADLVAKGQALIQQLELDGLLVTRSEKGMTLLEPGKPELHLPAAAREVYDVTGAGDTVISALATALAAGSPLDQACALANAAASVVVGKLGTSTVSALELGQAVAHNHQEGGYGVMSEAQLKYAVDSAKARGETVVMTNGCFDILHAGHVSYLQQARELGDRLIVAVNTDASVRKLKGDGRPVNSVDRRMAVLAGLGAVDWVVPFAEDTPQRLIGEVLPSVLVKGGDYRVEEIAGGQEVMANGGEVKILGFEDGCSTTAIINSIQSRAD